MFDVESVNTQVTQATQVLELKLKLYGGVQAKLNAFSNITTPLERATLTPTEAVIVGTSNATELISQTCLYSAVSTRAVHLTVRSDADPGVEVFVIYDPAVARFGGSKDCDGASVWWAALYVLSIPLSCTTRARNRFFASTIKLRFPSCCYFILPSRCYGNLDSLFFAGNSLRPSLLT